MPVISMEWFPEHVNAIKGDSGRRVGPHSKEVNTMNAPMAQSSLCKAHLRAGICHFHIPDLILSIPE